MTCRCGVWESETKSIHLNVNTPNKWDGNQFERVTLAATCTDVLAVTHKTVPPSFRVKVFGNINLIGAWTLNTIWHTPWRCTLVQCFGAQRDACQLLDCDNARIKMPSTFSLCKKSSATTKKKKNSATDASVSMKCSRCCSFDSFDGLLSITIKQW